MSDNSNPIKYHNVIFNNNWTSNQDNILEIFNKLKNNLEIAKQSKFTHIKTYVLDLIQHSIPIYYMSRKNKYSNMSFDEFNILFNKRMLDSISNYDLQINLKRYIKNFDLLPTDIQDLLINLHNGKFVSLDIKFYVENNLNMCKHFSSEHMDLYIFFSNNNYLEIDKLIKQIFTVSKWIYDLNPIYKIKFAYFDTPITKKIHLTNLTNLTDSEKFISSFNVNSGSSVSGKLLMIWRREELLKVLIHEIIHYLDMDLKNYKKLDIFKQIGKLKFPILVNETITELQAQFLHSIYISIIRYDGSFDTFQTIYNYEQIFSWYQFSKIMSFYDIKKFTSNELSAKFNQTTNVFAYYILKPILSLQWPDILLKLNHFKPNSMSDTMFDTISDTISNTMKCSVSNCPIILKNTLNIIKNLKIRFLNKIIKKLQTDDFSLKMTIFSLF